MLAEGISPDCIWAVAWGMEVEALGIRVKPVECHHWSMVTMAGGEPAVGTPLGMIITTEPGVRIYDGGDTSLFSDLKLIGELYRPNIGLMHVTLPRFRAMNGFRAVTGEMTPYEAVLATQWLGLEYVLPMHYFDADCQDVKDFCSLMETMSTRGPVARTIVLKPGESFIYTPQNQATSSEQSSGVAI
jgi:L-ascorbate metabolism protein UlaG (beta-lactamase superfamily)